MASSTNVVGSQGPSALKWALRVLVVGYLFLLVAWPTSLVVDRTFEDGLTSLTTALSQPEVVHSLKVTAIVAAAAVGF